MSSSDAESREGRPTDLVGRGSRGPTAGRAPGRWRVPRVCGWQVERAGERRAACLSGSRVESGRRAVVRRPPINTSCGCSAPFFRAVAALTPDRPISSGKKSAVVRTTKKKETFPFSIVEIKKKRFSVKIYRSFWQFTWFMNHNLSYMRKKLTDSKAYTIQSSNLL